MAPPLLAHAPWGALAPLLGAAFGGTVGSRDSRFVR
jgi:hypothetical protein